jgi:hypothetical protein
MEGAILLLVVLEVITLRTGGKSLFTDKGEGVLPVEVISDNGADAVGVEAVDLLPTTGAAGVILPPEGVEAGDAPNNACFEGGIKDGGREVGTVSPPLVTLMMRCIATMNSG